MDISTKGLGKVFQFYLRIKMERKRKKNGEIK